MSRPADAAATAKVVFDAFDRACPSRAVLDDMSGRWGLLVLAALLDGPLRFNELRRRVDGVSMKMLSQALQALERDGLVSRTPAPGRSQRVDYALTDLGRDGATRILELVRWIEGHMEPIGAAQRAFDARDAA